MCGGQLISCSCIYSFCGIDPATMKETHPQIYSGGPSDEMYAKWDKFYLPLRMPWTGVWPGVLECREFDFWCYWEEGRGWVDCDKDHPGARENLNRLCECRWDVNRQRFVLENGATNGVANGARH